MSHKTAKCCENCRNATKDGQCKIGALKSCVRWRDWFSKEWAKIRKAAEIIKKNNEREASSK